MLGGPEGRGPSSALVSQQGGMGRVTETTDRVRPRAGAASIGVRRHFTRAGQDVFDSVVWEIRTARIERADGEVVFEQKDVEVPRTWSALATNIVAS